jgi:hypothetical protein
MDASDFDEIMRIQRMMAQEVAEEQATDNKITLMSIINDQTNAKGMVQKEAVLIEARNQGMTEEQILNLIDELKQDNFLIEKAGYLKTL